jgi:hypothetical protein
MEFLQIPVPDGGKSKLPLLQGRGWHYHVPSSTTFYFRLTTSRLSHSSTAGTAHVHAIFCRLQEESNFIGVKSAVEGSRKLVIQSTTDPGSIQKMNDILQGLDIWRDTREREMPIWPLLTLRDNEYAASIEFFCFWERRSYYNLAG